MKYQLLNSRALYDKLNNETEFIEHGYPVSKFETCVMGKVHEHFSKVARSGGRTYTLNDKRKFPPVKMCISRRVFQWLKENLSGILVH